MVRIFKNAVKSLIPSRIAQFRAEEPGSVCLTFDDGPHENTGKILEILDRERVRATFFVNGRRVPEFKATLRGMAARGHGIGNHFHDHVSSRTIGAAEVARQIEALDAAVREAAGTEPRLIRPPYGDWSAGLFAYALRTRRKIVMWSLDTLDGDPETGSAGAILRNAEEVREGDILLMHDDNPKTVEALPGILRAIREKGLKISKAGT